MDRASTTKARRTIESTETEAGLSGNPSPATTVSQRGPNPLILLQENQPPKYLALKSNRKYQENYRST